MLPSFSFPPSPPFIAPVGKFGVGRGTIAGVAPAPAPPMRSVDAAAAVVNCYCLCKAEVD